MPVPLFIDSDNAMGSPFGDVDDGYAVAALLKSGKTIHGLSSVFGNSFEPWVHRNLRTLAAHCGYHAPVHRGAATWWSGPTPASRALAECLAPTRVLALGPLTNVALALRENPAFPQAVSEMVLVATNYSIRLPAFRFIDFNQWKDPKSFRQVLASALPLTFIPCDVARRLSVAPGQVAQLPGTVGRHLFRQSRRWFLRARWLKGRGRVPIWDLVAAMYTIAPELFETEVSTLRLGRMGQAIYGTSLGRPVRVVTGFSPEQVWEKFVSLFK